MTCVDYENRPLVCRSFLCARAQQRGCTECGECCTRLKFGAENNPDKVHWLNLMGVDVYEAADGTIEFSVPARCVNYRPAKRAALEAASPGATSAPAPAGDGSRRPGPIPDAA